MTEQQTRLALWEFGHHKHDLSGIQQTNVVRDIQTIHDATQSEGWKRVRRWGLGIGLRARPSKALQRMFAAEIDFSFDMMNVDLGDVSLPQQAMAWAAIQMYREKMGDTLMDFHAIDPRAETAEKFLSPGALGSYGIRREMRSARGLSPGPNVVIVPSDAILPPDHPYAIADASLVSVRQSRSEGVSLLGVLQMVEAEYQALYPYEDASLAVAGIVGARNMEVFASAWGQASAQGSSSTEHAAVVSAQALLGYGNDVFRLN